MKRLSCDEVRDLAAELALGILSGTERAEVLTHVAECRECQQLAARLAEAADLLLLVPPEAEPPSGFETRVLNRMSTPLRPRRARVLLAAAVIVLALVAGGVAVRVVGGDENGSGLRSAVLADRGGRRVGEVFVYDDDPAWMFVTVEGAPDGAYEIEVAFDDGRVERRPAPWMDAGDGSWGHTVDLDVDDLAAIRLIGEKGWRCEGVF
jgi:hypothetical protein